MSDIQHIDAKELLVSRRSIRRFTEESVSDDILWKVFEVCRYSPTSRNSQSYYFVVVRDREKITWLAGLRGENTAPIGCAPMAVAICADPARSQRYVQDGCIAAYHFLLAAWLFGLGTCWIAAMDRDDVKDELRVPREHYVATVSPLGYPAECPRAPAKRPVSDMVRFC